MEKPVVHKLAAHLFENLPVPFGIAQATWIERCEQAIGEFMLATPASTARTDGPRKIPSELALRHWAELIAIAALGPKNNRETYKEATGYVLGQLRGFTDEYFAAPGSIPQASQTDYDPCCGECGMNKSEHDGKDHPGGACANFSSVPQAEPPKNG